MGDTKKVLLEADGVMARLKAETAGQHSTAESRPFQRRLVAGTVSVAEYGQWLGQMLLVHRALESRLRPLAVADARVASVITEDQYREPGLLADLLDLGIDPGLMEPSAGTTALIAEVVRATPLHLLGMHYVLEGSTNGNRYIARSLRKALSIAVGHGDRYLDPYGDGQREKWAAFKAAMDRIEWNAADADTIVAGAVSMFDGISALSADLAS